MKKETFAERLRRLAGGSLLTHNQLCLAAGIPQSTFYNLLAGKSEPKLGTLSGLARAFGRNLDVWDGLAPCALEKKRVRKKKRVRP